MKRRYKLLIYLLVIWVVGLSEPWFLMPQAVPDLVRVLGALGLVLLVVGGLFWVLWRPERSGQAKVRTAD